MYSSKTLKTLFLTSAALVSEDKMSCKECKPSMCRPSELPIYTPEPTAPVRKESENAGVVAATLENIFATVRKQYTTVYNEIKAYERVGQDYVEQSKENLDLDSTVDYYFLCSATDQDNPEHKTVEQVVYFKNQVQMKYHRLLDETLVTLNGIAGQGLLDYLRQEDNTTPKAGAIAIGGLAGLIFGLRGGLFKKTVYATTGALSMAAVCYPQEAAEYSQIALGEAKKYATIAYNFAYGVKKGDPPLELPTLPQIPSSLSDAWQTVTKSASSLIVSEPNPEEQVMLLGIGGEESSVLNDDTSPANPEVGLGIITKAHEKSSESCDCPVGPCLGPHDETLNNSSSSSSRNCTECVDE